MIDLNIHDHTFGSQFLEFIATLISGIIIGSYAIVECRDREIPFHEILLHRDLRIMMGAMTEFLGRAFGTLCYLPVWPMFSSGFEAMGTEWAEGVGPLAILSSFMTVAGLVIIMWGWLYSRFGRATIYVAVGAIGALYFAAAYVSVGLAALIFMSKQV